MSLPRLGQAGWSTILSGILCPIPCGDDELLAEEGVLGNELGVATRDIEGRAEKDGIARRPGELEESPFQRQQCGAYASDKPVD